MIFILHVTELHVSLTEEICVSFEVSKGINFRDGHSCSSRCGPSRYCLMTGRAAFRRGHYHYNPMFIEYGRKLISHLFKRNNYKTILVGKQQPLGHEIIPKNKENNDYVAKGGPLMWGYDESFVPN